MNGILVLQKSNILTGMIFYLAAVGMTFNPGPGDHLDQPWPRRMTMLPDMPARFDGHRPHAQDKSLDTNLRLEGFDRDTHFTIGI